MFRNMGGKIKKLAKFICWTCIVLSILGGAVLMLAGFAAQSILQEIELEFLQLDNMGILIVGVAVMVLGSLVSWLSSLFLYAFGELIDNHSQETAMLRNEVSRKERLY